MKPISHPDTFQCEICSKEYETPERALECEASKPTPKYSLGQVVLPENKWYKATRIDSMTLIARHHSWFIAGHEWQYTTDRQITIESSDPMIGDSEDWQFSEGEITTLIEGKTVVR